MFYIGIILQLSLIIGIHRSVVIAKGCDNNNRMSFYESERRIRSDERPRTYIQLIQRVGESGKYQKRLLWVLGLSWFVTGIILLSTGFLFRSPALNCQSSGLLVPDIHCEKYICSLKEDEWQNYLSADNHFHSLATSGNYLCSNSVTIALVSSCTYVGAFVGYMAVSFLADNFGRRRALLGSWVVCTVGTVVVASSMRIEVAAVGFFLSGFGSDVALNLTLLFFAEEVGGKKRQKYSIIVQMFFAIGALVSIFFFYIFDHWRVVWIVLVAVPAIVELLLIHSYIQETPQFLLYRGVSHALPALNRIGKVNLDRKQTLQQQDLQNVVEYQLVQEFKDKIITPIDLCRFSSLRGAAVACCVLAFFTYAMYYGPALIMEEVGFNIFLSGALVQLSEIISYLPAYAYIQKMPRRKTGIVLFSIVAVFSFILAFLQRPKDCDGCAHQILQLIVAFLFRSCVSLFFCIFEVYICELFPGRIRAMGTGFASAFGTLAAVLNRYYLGAIRRNGLNAFNLFLMMAITAITCLALLPQTLQKGISQDIIQMEEQMQRRRSVITMRSPKIRRRDHKSQITYDMIRSKNSKMVQSNRLD